ncbi:MAG: Arm DNA-binding domain-containing protein, partial [Alphaproteobacteria bacterium]
MSKQFTDASIRALKLTSKTGDRYEKFEPSGLGIRVGNKSKAFIFLYRHNRKPRRMTLGRYPEMALVGARLALAEAKKRLEKGEDPGAKAIEQRRAERDAETVNE